MNRDFFMGFFENSVGKDFQYIYILETWCTNNYIWNGQNYSIKIVFKNKIPINENKILINKK